MRRAIHQLAISSLAVLLGSAGVASAQSGPIAHMLCAPPAEMRERLETRYGANRSWSGLRAPDQVMELWEDGKGEWTLIVQYAGGNWCIVAFGEALSPYDDLPHG